MSQLITKIKVIWSHIVAIFKKTITIADQDFVLLVGEAQAAQFVETVKAILKTSAGKIVVDVVEALTASELGCNPSARAAAYEKIVADLKLNGLSASQEIINLLINLAIWIINNKVPLS